MPSTRELLGGVAFFALAAGALVAFRRPMDAVGWAGLAGCIGFVVLGSIALLRGPRRQGGETSVRPGRPFGLAVAPAGIAQVIRGVEEDDEPIGEPSPEELRLLEKTIAALEAVGALEAGEVDAGTLWRAARRIDPDRAVGIHEAVGSFSALHDLGRERIGRLTFVPAHTEYDRGLIREIAACALASLGHAVAPEDVSVELPPDGGEGPARIAFTVGGRAEAVTCHYRWKYPPDDLLPALGRFRVAEDPRDLVWGDSGDQTLLFAAIRAGTLGDLNRRLAADRELFGAA